MVVKKLDCNKTILLQIFPLQLFPFKCEFFLRGILHKGLLEHQETYCNSKSSSKVLQLTGWCFQLFKNAYSVHGHFPGAPQSWRKHAVCPGNFAEVTEQILGKIGPENSKLTYSHGQYLFHYVSDRRIIYMCITEDVSEALAFARMRRALKYLYDCLIQCVTYLYSRSSSGPELSPSSTKFATDSSPLMARRRSRKPCHTP